MMKESCHQLSIHRMSVVAYEQNGVEHPHDEYGNDAKVYCTRLVVMKGLALDRAEELVPVAVAGGAGGIFE